MNGSETRALMGLTCVLEPGQAGWNRLVDRDGAEAAWARLLRDDSTQGSRARGLDLETIERETRLRGLRFVHRTSEEWLPALDDLASTGAVGGIDGGRPLGLWLAGPVGLSEIGATGVAVVGSRASTPYGDTVASELAAELAEAGTVIVSGGAFGIDAAAHRGALSCEGATVAVMSCGLDQLYPRGNDALLRRVRDTGLVVSEYPPGATPTRHRFLTRNRLIAALAAATVIVEAAARSGAKNTVGWAQALGRPVLAVPGPVTSALSVTPHRLIREAQAALVTNASDVLAELAPLGVLQPPLVDPESRATDELDPDELAIREALPARRSVSVDELRASLGVGVAECLGALGSLADRGHVQALEDGTWRLVAPPRRPGGQGRAGVRSSP